MLSTESRFQSLQSLPQDDIDPSATPRTPRERIGLTGNLASISMPGDSGAEVTPRPIEFSDSDGELQLVWVQRHLTSLGLARVAVADVLHRHQHTRAVAAPARCKETPRQVLMSCFAACRRRDDSVACQPL
jgi:hypothetical protein